MFGAILPETHTQRKADYEKIITNLAFCTQPGAECFRAGSPAVLPLALQRPSSTNRVHRSGFQTYHQTLG